MNKKQLMKLKQQTIRRRRIKLKKMFRRYHRLNHKKMKKINKVIIIVQSNLKLPRVSSFKTIFKRGKNKKN